MYIVRKKLCVNACNFKIYSYYHQTFNVVLNFQERFFVHVLLITNEVSVQF